ncbi:LysR family transcriptional regulator [Massilia sp. R2A-15]|uniref:LysR family transcriptional regulator n=1 Tax=Massilia sp. R2A-15 TaxID=3064278 RepID=UPI00273387C8|nr:LysR family transcriptional regulator [Massilia sp. R2A-15]WLI88404.1 LysR family transcriptional regulator [Massilia sp. R2A-15]
MDLHRIDLNLLVSLDVLLAERNVTHAARRLALSQPALSAQLRQLRDLFRDPLLLPASRGMTPTARALELQAPLRDMLAALGGLVAERQPFDPATARDTFRIATTDSMQAVLCVPLIARLRVLAPGVRVALFGADVARLAEQMASGEIDLALLTPQGMPAALKTRALFDETFLCVLRRGHPAADTALDLDTFCSLDHALVSTAGGGFVGVVDDVLARLGRSRRVVVSLPSFLVAPALVADSDVICTVPARLARRWSASLAVMAPPCEVGEFSMRMGWHPRAHSDPAQRWLRDQVAAVAAA